MTSRAGQKMVGAYMDAALAERFAAWARQIEGGASAAIRRLVSEAIEGKSPAGPGGAGLGHQIGVRLKGPERALLTEVARARSTSPANWLRSLAIVHLSRKPQWNAAELDGLRLVARELGAIGNNVNQIARALNTAVHKGEYSPDQGRAAKEAAELVRYEMRRVAALITANFDYWGCPTDERPEPVINAERLETQVARIAERKRKRGAAGRPTRFLEE